MKTKVNFNEHRNFGIELETNVKPTVSRATLIQELEIALTRIGHMLDAHGRYQHDTDTTNRTIWKLKRDGSLGMRGVELVSPVLRGYEGLEAVRVATEVLRQYTRVDSRCGFHVHHDVRDFTQRKLANIYRAYRRDGHYLDRLVSKGRRSLTGPGGQIKRPKWSQEVCPLVAEEGYKSDMECLDVAKARRMQACNFQSLAMRGTVEIRHHQGTVDPRKVRSWIVLTQGIIESANTGSQLSMKPSKSFYEFRYRIGLTSDRKGVDEIKRDADHYWSKRFEAFLREDFGTVAKGVAHMKRINRVQLASRNRYSWRRASGIAHAQHVEELRTRAVA